MTRVVRPLRVLLYADAAALVAQRPGRIVAGQPSMQRALRAAAYALGGLGEVPPGGWALARIIDAHGAELTVLARLTGRMPHWPRQDIAQAES